MGPSVRISAVVIWLSDGCPAFSVFAKPMPVKKTSCFALPCVSRSMFLGHGSTGYKKTLGGKDSFGTFLVTEKYSRKS